MVGMSALSTLQGMGALSPASIEITDAQKGVFTLLPLPYPYNGLEPAIDAKTVEIHYTRHHKIYLDTLNKLIADTPLHLMQ